MITGPVDTVKRARKLRSEMSLPELVLWRELRKRPGGFKFRRQHAASHYVLDFYCASARLAIEVDGWAHDTLSTAQADTRRSHFLRSQGVATVRVPAKAVLDNVEAASQRIVEICQQRIESLSRTSRVPLHHPAATGAPARPATADGLPPAGHSSRLRPPPRAGEERG